MQYSVAISMVMITLIQLSYLLLNTVQITINQFFTVPLQSSVRFYTDFYTIINYIFIELFVQSSAVFWLYLDSSSLPPTTVHCHWRYRTAFWRYNGGKLRVYICSVHFEKKKNSSTSKLLQGPVFTQFYCLTSVVYDFFPLFLVAFDHLCLRLISMELLNLYRLPFHATFVDPPIRFPEVLHKFWSQKNSKLCINNVMVFSVL